MVQDYYQRLGVSRTASPDDIKKAYRKLARQHHPDHNPGNASAEERFKQVNEAFEVLSDPKKRRLYDEFGDDAAKLGWDEKKADAYRSYRRPPSGGGPGFGGMPFDFGGAGGDGAGFDFESILGEMFGGRGRRGGARAGGDVEMRLEVDLADAVLGAERSIVAGGRRLTVRIPPGVDTGSRVRLAGQGEPGDRGGPAGDLFVEVRVRPHPSVRRDGKDLYADLPVTLREAALGAEVPVPIFGGSGKVTIRPGTQSGMKLRLRGKGVPGLRGSEAGDLYFVVQVKIPPSLDDAARRALDVLESAYTADVRADLKL